jgi:hypothetical protein
MIAALFFTSIGVFNVKFNMDMKIIIRRVIYSVLFYTCTKQVNIENSMHIKHHLDRSFSLGFC